MIPLFQHYPALQQAIPHLPLALLPTPVEPWSNLGRETSVGALYVKRDDISGEAYGGNKVRKLEFLLARARARGAQSVLTFGAAGSNHALATAIYARQLGLQAISMLVPQQNAHTVQRNLLRGQVAGASLRLFGGRKMVSEGTVAEIVARHRAGLALPFIIPAGGSAPLGVVGFVNAAFELRAQIEAGQIPEPDRIYVASGTMGTCVGLALGLAAAGLKTRVVAVRVTTAPYTTPEKARKLFSRTLGLLRRADPSFPDRAFPEAQFSLRDEFLGEGYARYTEAGAAAVRAVKALEGVSLEGTYTGKALACLISDGASGILEGQTVLFWNTYNGQSQEDVLKNVDYHQLPEGFHRYFQEPVQALDA
jgi:D-cysteine desulfhydrase